MSELKIKCTKMLVGFDKLYFNQGGAEMEGEASHT